MARILVIASFTPSLVLFRGDMLAEFRARGHEVICCSPAPDPRTLKQLEDLEVSHLEFRLQRTGMNPLADLTAMRDLRHIMAEIRPDHVLSYTIKPVIYGSLAAGMQKVPAIHAMITGLGTTFLGSGLKGTLLNSFARFMYRAALKKCRTVFFQNRDDRQLFLDGGLVDKNKTVMINGSGVNLERFPSEPVPEGRQEFLMIGRLIRDKGIREFVAAVRLVKSRHPDVVFRVVGMFDNHPGSITRRQMDEWTAEGLLTYDGPTDDVRSALASCTVYCLPSYREGMPRSVLEAMATGRAIITTDAPGCRDTVDEGENGFLVPVRDPEALAAAMERFIAEPDLARRMGEVSRGLAEEKFDVRRVNEKILDSMGL
ncbi:MAG: glycosyltransferase family 4 protein [Candidatus Krumholzibacteria bacterium]|nr:glycosyltransferase family 4 protein [Candidatus Krumholzibacteria bacterium]